MNDNLNLCEMLKDCPRGTKLYSTIYGNVELDWIEEDCGNPIKIKIPKYDCRIALASDGRLQKDYDGECTLFPSKEQRDWSKFKMNKPKFDPKTLKPFDKVLLFNHVDMCWVCDFYSHKIEKYECNDYRLSYVCVGDATDKIIPYNEDTKHLVGAADEAPEYYRYWED